MPITIGGHFCFVDGEVKSNNKEGRIMTWDNVDVDIKCLHGGYDRETKETVLASKEELKSIRFIIELSPGDVVTVKTEAKDYQTGETSEIDIGCLEKLHLKFMLPECGKNEWKKYKEKHDTITP